MPERVGRSPRSEVLTVLLTGTHQVVEVGEDAFAAHCGEPSKQAAGRVLPHQGSQEVVLARRKAFCGQKFRALLRPLTRLVDQGTLVHVP